MTVPSASPLSSLSAAQRQRLAFIEFRVWFFGAVVRKHVLEHFEVATAAGTRDLALYKQLAPMNVRYEQKVYHYQPTFEPLFSHEVGRVLAALTSGFGNGDRRIPHEILSHDEPRKLNQPGLETLATVTRAIHAGQALSLTYFSMKNGAEKRVIVPHSLVDSGLRWHVRAFDRTKGHFRDLVLTRMEDVATLEDGSTATQQESIDSDEQWNDQVLLTLVPHPAHLHPEVIAKDFGMQDGKLTVSLRGAVAGYVLRQWQVDCSAGASMRGREIRLRLEDLGPLRDIGSAALAPGHQIEVGPIPTFDPLNKQRLS